MNSAHETEFRWIVLCFLVTSMTAIVAPLETTPTSSFTSSWRMSFSALRTAGAGLVSSSSEMISTRWPRTPPLAFSSSTAIWMPIEELNARGGDLGAEVADPHDLRLGDGGRRGPHEGGDHREHDDPGYTLHDPLLAGGDDSMRTERTWAIRARGSRRPAGAAGPFASPAPPSEAGGTATRAVRAR